jgi:DNA-binding NarL/FixJ family response regulator
MSDDLRVTIVEDERETRDGLATLIRGTAGLQIVAAWRSMEEALSGFVAANPDVLLADIRLPGMSGIDGVGQIHAARPDLPILMLTVYDDSDSVFRAICAGACGYLLKDTPPTKLVEAIRDVAAGGSPMSSGIARKVVRMFKQTAPPPNPEHNLSPRELEVLRLLADGHSYKTAAVELDLSVDTLRFHVRHIYEKLHVHSKSEAVLKAFRKGILPGPGDS